MKNTIFYINKKTVNILQLLLIVLIITSCNSKKEGQEPVKEDRKILSETGKPYLNFENKEYDLGKVNFKKLENKTLAIDFTFTNETEKPIIITKADVSCGCLSTQIPEKPVLNKEKGVVKVFVDTKQLNGYFDKKIYVNSNAENDVVLLHVNGTVKK